MSADVFQLTVNKVIPNCTFEIPIKSYHLLTRESRKKEEVKTNGQDEIEPIANEPASKPKRSFGLNVDPRKKKFIFHDLDVEMYNPKLGYRLMRKDDIDPTSKYSQMTNSPILQEEVKPNSGLFQSLQQRTPTNNKKFDDNIEELLAAAKIETLSASPLRVRRKPQSVNSSPGQPSSSILAKRARLPQSNDIQVHDMSNYRERRINIPSSQSPVKPRRPDYNPKMKLEPLNVNKRVDESVNKTYQSVFTTINKRNMSMDYSTPQGKHKPLNLSNVRVNADRSNYLHERKMTDPNCSPNILDMSAGTTTNAQNKSRDSKRNINLFRHLVSQSIGKKTTKDTQNANLVRKLFYNKIRDMAQENLN